MGKRLFYTVSIILFVLLLCCFCSCSGKCVGGMDQQQKNNSMYLFVGTYTSTDSKGIYIYEFDTLLANFKYVNTVNVENPSYLVLNSDEKFLYAVSENDSKEAYANAFSFDNTSGELSFMNRQMTGNLAPCYINVDKERKHVITADYLGGITVFPVDKGGKLKPHSQIIEFEGAGVNPERQTQTHIHFVEFTPDENYLFANDLGLDRIHKFKINKGTDSLFLGKEDPESFKVTDGVGPRHLEFHPNGKYAYLITEMGGTVIAFSYKDGILKQFQTIQADTLHAKGSADIHISPDGHYLYASNRLQGDGIAIFSIDQSNGELTKIGYQATEIHPRNFVITPNGRYLLVACRDSDLIQIFKINKENGLLENTSKTIEVSMPVCLKFASMKN